ncbi:copper homeostasis protein CutC [Agarivorans sp. DSG3-1]|uniref:copper homeostasis protein CutC n=1 Tax=Agarivorans sp. DSG3-1 TaxID=3342249 RepID=UPI00398EB6BD
MFKSESNSPVLEICCYSISDVKNAISGGATRVEFCAGQAEGGTTPSYGALLLVKDYLSQIDITVMIRPRGGDFCYSDDEVAQMVADITMVKDLGFNGVVFGALNADASVDELACQQLVNAAKGLSTTFHRAFDCVAEPKKAAKQIDALNITRVLSSGQKNNIEDGLNLLLDMQQCFPTIEWLAAGGLREHNILGLLNSGLRHFHSAASTALPSQFDKRYALAMAAEKDSDKELSRLQVSQQQVKQMVAILGLNTQ